MDPKRMLDVVYRWRAGDSDDLRATMSHFLAEDALVSTYMSGAYQDAFELCDC